VVVLRVGSAPNIYLQFNKNKLSPEKSTKSPIKWPFFAILSNKKMRKNKKIFLNYLLFCGILAAISFVFYCLL